MSSHDSHGGVVLMAFVVGAIAGAAVALMWAPAPGDETRRFLGEKARDSRERATDVARQGREFIDRQRETLSTAVDKGREAYEQARHPSEP